jgi:hypothetical protein
MRKSSSYLNNNKYRARCERWFLNYTASKRCPECGNMLRWRPVQLRYRERLLMELEGRKMTRY